MQDLLGDLIPKGEKCGSKQGMFPTKGERYSQEGKVYPPKGENADWIKSTYERRVANRGRNNGDHGFRGRPNRHWMMVSIQASVSSLNCQFLQILY